MSESGYGYEDGYGYGYEDGYGYGYEDGYGDGFGYGDGYGFGYGDGIPLGAVAGYTATVLAPWPVVRVGCQARTLGEWERKWADVARTHGVRVTAEEATALIAAARRALEGVER